MFPAQRPQWLCLQRRRFVFFTQHTEAERHSRPENERVCVCVCGGGGGGGGAVVEKGLGRGDVFSEH